VELYFESSVEACISDENKTGWLGECGQRRGHSALAGEEDAPNLRAMVAECTAMLANGQISFGSLISRVSGILHLGLTDVAKFARQSAASGLSPFIIGQVRTNLKYDECRYIPHPPPSTAAHPLGFWHKILNAFRPNLPR
jgi:hypothetical protein